jgi:hypothetical protein
MFASDGLLLLPRSDSAAAHGRLGIALSLSSD